MKKNNQNLKSDSKNPISYFLFSKFSVVLLLSTFYFLFSVGSVFAAEIFIDSKSQTIGVGDEFETEFFLGTDNENINAIEGKIVFPEKLLELKEIRDGNSIINFWIERPSKQQETSDTRQKEIVFSGIIPGGYLGNQGLILSAIFQAKKEGGGVVEIRDAKVLLNDGKGTSANLSIFNFQFSVTHETTRIETLIDTKKDIDPPEDFRPEIASDSSIFDGKYFLVFATQDKNSGIDYYEILEKREFRILNFEIRELIRKILYPKSYILNSWVTAESPYVLKDQKLRSWIYIKAIDKAGNERIAVVEPRYPMRWYEFLPVWIIIGIGILIIYLVGRILWRRHTKQH